VPAKTADEPQLLEDLAKLLAAERKAREAALAEVQKLQEWRFVHFTEEFRDRLSKVELLIGIEEASPSSPSQEQRLCEPEARSCDNVGHSLGQRMAGLEAMLTEVSRREEAFETRLERLERPAELRLAEVEAIVQKLDCRLAGVEAPVPLRPLPTAARLKSVEPLEAQDLAEEDRRSEASTRLTASHRSSDYHDRDLSGGQTMRQPSGRASTFSGGTQQALSRGGSSTVASASYASFARG